MFNHILASRIDHSSSESGFAQSQIALFNPKDLTISPGPALPMALKHGHNLVQINLDKLFIFGGYDGSYPIIEIGLITLHTKSSFFRCQFQLKAFHLQSNFRAV